MALSMKNTLVSLSLSGAMLFAGFLTSETPIKTDNATVGVAYTQQQTIRMDSKVSTGTSSKKIKQTFAAPYFSFGKSGLTQGANQ